MQVKTKGRIVVTAMIDLGLHGGHGPVPLAAISKRQGISLSYLEQLFGKLRRQQFVESTRGPGGGYRLCRSQDTISVADLVAAVDDAPKAEGREIEADWGDAASRVVTRALWADLGTHMNDHLASISLKSLVDAQRATGVMPTERPQSIGITPRPDVRTKRLHGPNSVFTLADSLQKSTLAS
jgi:Rrf2 family iron-sulfur cluster assembly transcriptional regulator